LPAQVFYPIGNEGYFRMVVGCVFQLDWAMLA
jgi:hypothetical protein